MVVFHFGSWKICKLTQKFCGFSSKIKKIGRKTRRIHMSVFVCLVTSMLHSSPSSSTKERKRWKKKKTIKQPGTDTVFPAFQSQNVCGLRHRFPRKGNDVYAIADEILKQHVSAVLRRRQRWTTNILTVYGCKTISWIFKKTKEKEAKTGWRSIIVGPSRIKKK